MSYELKEPVFVVDDEEDLRELIGDAVGSLGLPIEVFTNANDALAKLASVQPCLVISDYRMPGMDGVSFCKEFRKRYEVIPFVVVTGYADKEMVVSGLTAGVNEVLDKPFTREQLLGTVKKYVDRRIVAIETERRELEEITEIYIEESTDLLSDLDHLIMRLEEDPLDSLVIDSLFRKIHSIKGGAGAIPGAGELAKVGHDFESALALIRKGAFKPDAACVDVFLHAYDVCQRLIKGLKQREAVSQELFGLVESTIQSLKRLGSTEHQVDAAKPVSQTSRPGSGPENIEDSKKEDDGLWVPSDKLDAFMNLSGELVVLKNYFQSIWKDIQISESNSRAEKKLSEFSYKLNKITDHFQSHIMSVRKVRLERALGKIPRVIRQTSQDVGKRVRLNMIGLDLGVDKNIANALSASLVHMVRNAIDHGIEKPEVRAKSSKSQEGNLAIAALEANGMIQITVADDGAGIRKDRVLKKALEKNLITEEAASRLSEEEIYDLIFLPGFSTAESVSSVSGRGVGMDVVKSALANLNGKIRVESEEGAGSKFHLEIPIPKSVMVEQTVLARSKESVIAIPLTVIAHIASCDELIVTHVSQVRSCQFNGRTIPLRTYTEYLDDRNVEADDDIKQKSLVVIQHKDRMLGLVVDRIEGQMEAVVRPFDNVVKSLPGFKGVTVLGDDGVAYIVSSEKMVETIVEKISGSLQGAA